MYRAEEEATSVVGCMTCSGKGRKGRDARQRSQFSPVNFLDSLFRSEWVGLVWERGQRKDDSPCLDPSARRPSHLNEEGKR